MGLNDLATLVLVIASWIVLQYVILPRLGVPS